MDRQKIRVIKYGKYIMAPGAGMEILHSDEGFTELTGYSAEEALNMTYMDLIPEEDREEQLQFLAKIMVGENPEGYLEHRMKRKDGTVGYVFCFGHPYWGDDFKGCTEVIIGDTTDTKYYQQSMRNEIKEKNRAFDTLVSSVPGGVITFEINEENQTMEILTANDEFFSIIGWSREEYMSGKVNMNAGTSILPEYHDELKKAYAVMKNDNSKAISVEFRIVRYDGNVAWIRCRSRYFRHNEENGRQRFFCIVVDITQEKYTELDLEVKSKFYKKTADYHNNDCIFRYNIEMKTIYLTSIKTGTSKLFYDAAELENYIYPNHRASFKTFLDRLTHYVEEAEIEVRTTFCSEDYHWCKITAGSISRSDSIYQIDGTIADINITYSEENVTQDMLDASTGFYKSIVMQDCVRRAFEKIDPDRITVLMFFGLKNFESIVEFLGTIYTDIVVKNIAKNIRRVTPENYVIGRISSYEFLVMFDAADEDEIVEYADKIFYAVKNTYISTDNHNIFPAVGAAVSGKDGNDYKTVFSKANAAFRESLKPDNKEGIVFYEDSMPYDITLSYSSKNIPVTYHSRGDYDIDFVNFVFALMSGTKDIDGAINIILEQIGERYNVEYAVVYDRIGKVMHISNQWLAGKGIVENITDNDVTTFDSYIKKFNRYGIRAVKNIEELKVSEYEKSMYRERGIKALLATAFFDTEKNINGNLTVCDTKNIREWDEYEKKTLMEVSKILYVFVRLRKERDKDRSIIAKLSTTDSLTGIYNIDAFKKEAAHKVRYSFEKAGVYAVAYIDLNNFSFINENYGYSVGDRTLINLANDFKNMDCCLYACRRYSDYFILLFAADNREIILREVETSAARIAKWQRKYNASSDLRLNVGLYFITDARYNIETAIENANIARKEAKSDNTVMWKIYDENMRRTRDNELMVAGEFPDALENDELELYMQPKFHLKTRRIVGAEALVRWRLPDGTIRYPDSFVPALEKNGDIVKLDFYMYEKLLKAMKRWQEEEMDMVPVSVNFSRVHTRYNNFVKRVCDLADKYGVDKNYIEVEITEGALNGTNKMMEDIMKLKNNGFKVDIDDFGTGYSSLNLLLEPLFDVVKVDKSIINSISNEKEKNYVKKLVELIRNSDKRIIFEGIETEEQADLLISCGCHTGQGYLFSKPVPLAEFENKYL